MFSLNIGTTDHSDHVNAQDDADFVGDHLDDDQLMKDGDDFFSDLPYVRVAFLL